MDDRGRDLERAAATAEACCRRRRARQPSLRYLVRIDDGSSCCTRSLLQPSRPTSSSRGPGARGAQGAEHRGARDRRLHPSAVPRPARQLAVRRGARPLRGTSRRAGRRGNSRWSPARTHRRAPVSCAGARLRRQRPRRRESPNEARPEACSSPTKPLYKPWPGDPPARACASSGEQRAARLARRSRSRWTCQAHKIFEAHRDRRSAASQHVRIGSIVNTGEFKVHLVSGETTTRRSSPWGRYALPRFEVAVED